MSEKWDVIIIGAGAAGLMCSAVAGYRDRSVLLLEHNKQIGRKILISGGGRCNFTNLNVSSKDFYSSNEHFSKSALSRYQPQEFIDLIERHELSFNEKKLGQLFCDQGSKAILKALETECEYAGVQIKTEVTVSDVKKEESFIVTTSEGIFESESLVIATGGLSIPTIGATDFGHRIAKQFGLKLSETRPALVPFVLESPNVDLAGISLPVKISTGKISIDEDLLFTHKGLSGPAALKISLYWNSGEKIKVNFLPELDVFEFLKNEREKSKKKKLGNILKALLPARFVESLEFELEKEMANVSNTELRAVGDYLNFYSFTPKSTEGYRKAEVTRGGVQTDELSSKTLEAKKCSNLFFIGEVIDITGQLGGYNFQWAWASANAAGHVA